MAKRDYTQPSLLQSLAFFVFREIRYETRHGIVFVFTDKEYFIKKENMEGLIDEQLSKWSNVMNTNTHKALRGLVFISDKTKGYNIYNVRSYVETKHEIGISYIAPFLVSNKTIMQNELNKHLAWRIFRRKDYKFIRTLLKKHNIR